MPERSFNKLNRLTVTYQEPETAIRIGLISKVVSDIQASACSDGTAQCGPNSVCVQLEAIEEYEVKLEPTNFFLFIFLNQNLKKMRVNILLLLTETFVGA